jgi:hypothetical protein
MRRTIVVFALPGILAADPRLLAQSVDAPALIARAIEAHGGEARLTRFQAGHSKARGTIFMKTPVRFTQELFYQLPSQYKEIKEGFVDGRRFLFTLVFDGDRGWTLDNGRAQEVNDKLLAEIMEETHLLRVRRLTALRGDPHSLSLAPATVVDGLPADGVRVSAKGFRDVTLFFDRASGLLVKMERRTVGPLQALPVTEERIFSEYRTIAGLASPSKTVVNLDGKKFLEVEMLEVQFLEHMDPRTFQKP